MSTKLDTHHQKSPVLKRQQKPTIFALSTAVPTNRFAQAQFAQIVGAASGLSEEQCKWLQRLYRNSKIKYRHLVFEETQGVKFFSRNHSHGTSARNELYKQEAPKLAHRAAEKALQTWGMARNSITHIIFVSCTGVLAPGVEVALQKSLDLNVNINRIGLNMMGCFGAFKALDLAAAYAMQNPQHRILVVSCELCSLHFQPTTNPEQQIGNALFADGAAACIVGTFPQKTERSLYIIENTASSIVPQTLDKITWEATDSGFLMGIKPEVPNIIKQNITAFMQQLVPNPIKLAECLFPVHAGGKEILQAVQNSLALSPEQLASSWHVLEQYGNMSSATFLFILEHMQTEHAAWCVGLGFGPGLAFEGLLLRKPNVD